MDQLNYIAQEGENQVTAEKLAEILENHKKWLADDGGCRANLSGANLSGADLSRADLSGANLSGAKGLLDTVNYMEAHFERVERGYIVYKTFGSTYEPPTEWEIKPESIITETVNFDRCTECGSGINVAPLEWVKREYPNKQIWKCLIEWPWLVGVCVPYNTDGKIRASRVRLLEVVSDG